MLRNRTAARRRPRSLRPTREGDSERRATDRTTTITQSITALTAIGAVVFTGLSLDATREQVAAVQKQNAVAEQGQFTDRYTRAVEQLGQAGADRVQVRLGAIYALERLSRDSPHDQPTIVEVLTAFVRTTAPRPTVGGQRSDCPQEPVPVDVQAALSVVGRRDPAHDGQALLNLGSACLRNAVLMTAHLTGAYLAYSDLTGAYLAYSDLTGAQMDGARLDGANMYSAQLDHARLGGAHLEGAWLGRASLAEADLSVARLKGAHLGEASLIGTNLTGAGLINSFLTGADLRGARLAQVDLRRADLTGADLRGTFLSGVDLRGARLRTAIHDHTTVVMDPVTDAETTGTWW
ncbi:pentapeptide repeat-containing protein [Actinosynnema sp. CA-248983]